MPECILYVWILSKLLCKLTITDRQEDRKSSAQKSPHGGMAGRNSDRQTSGQKKANYRGRASILPKNILAGPCVLRVHWYVFCCLEWKKLVIKGDFFLSSRVFEDFDNPHSEGLVKYQEYQKRSIHVASFLISYASYSNGLYMGLERTSFRLLWSQNGLWEINSSWGI